MHRVQATGFHARYLRSTDTSTMPLASVYPQLLAVVDGQPGLRRHLDRDLLVRFAAGCDPLHVPLGTLLAQIPDGHGALAGIVGRAGDRRGPGCRDVLVRP